MGGGQSHGGSYIRLHALAPVDAGGSSTFGLPRFSLADYQYCIYGSYRQRPAPPMDILTYTQIGTRHSNHNEDAHAVGEVSDRHTLVAVVNGSAAGHKGYFAAALVAQLLETIASQTNLRNFAEKGNPTAGDLLRDCLRELLKRLSKQRTQLGLTDEELRLILNLGILDHEQRIAEIAVIGAGVITCDGETVEMAQYEEVDYLGNHLDKSEFDHWWAYHDKRIRCENCLDVAIATPGILTFEPFSHDSYRPVTEDEILDFLLAERNDGPLAQLFRRKFIYIEEKFGLLATDDVTIIRALFI